MNIRDLLEQQAGSLPEKAAVIFQDTPITFKELRAVSFSVAALLTRSGVGRGEKVAIFLPNSPQYIFSYFAVLSIGAVSVAMDFMLAEEEIINFINHSEAKVLIAHSRNGLDLDKVKSSCPSLEKIIESGSLCAVDPTATVLPEGDIDEDSVSSIFYTSGSTGRPKGVLLTYGHFNNPIKVIDKFLKVSRDDVFLCGGVPFSHLGGLDYILFMLYFGSTLVLMERFSPVEFLRNTEKYKVSIFCIVPAMYVAILSLKEYDKFDFSSLRYAVVFGAPSSPELLSRFNKAYPQARLLNGWGMTETSAPNAYSPEDITKLSSIGKLDFEIEARIVDDEGNNLPSGRDGELWVKGKCVMSGYYKDPELTAEVLTGDGWLKTGDIARQDKDGLYYIVGRKKDMIKVAGEIVVLAEVESVFQRHPKIKEAAVIGVNDDLRGEVPKAFIVLKDGENADESEMRDFARAHLAHFKIPHFFLFVKELPKNRVGKVDKMALKRL